MLAKTALTGLLWPTLVLTTPITSTSTAVASLRPATVILASLAFPFVALSLLHSPSLGRRRRQRNKEAKEMEAKGWRQRGRGRRMLGVDGEGGVGFIE